LTLNGEQMDRSKFCRMDKRGCLQHEQAQSNRACNIYKLQFVVLSVIEEFRFSLLSTVIKKKYQHCLSLGSYVSSHISPPPSSPDYKSPH
jgi:hypothetical protein